MKTFAAILASAAFAAVAVAECPNGCSGHGTCGSSDACDCFDNWMGGDCSQRVCPFGSSFIDTPLGDLNHNGMVAQSDAVNTQFTNNVVPEMSRGDLDKGEAHAYSECSNKGFCDRAAGTCACFDGFTGSACQRTTCPNDCSGHGQCYTLREIAAGPNVAVTHPTGSGSVGRNFKVVDYKFGSYYTSGVSSAFEYNLWDADKNQACVCDAGYFGPDCSMLQCPKGNDPLTNDPKHCGGSDCTSEIQAAYIKVDTTANVETDFFLEWEDKEEYSGLLTKLRSDVFTVKAGLTGDDYAEILQDALETFPNGALNGVSVSCEGLYDNNAGPAAYLDAHLQCVTPMAVTGDRELVLKLDFTNGPQGDLNGLEAKIVSVGESKTGDLTTSIPLKFFDDSAAGGVDSAAVGGDYAARNGIALTNGPVSYTPSDTSRVTTAPGNQENSPCSNRGLCDFATGTCQCFAGYTREDCSVQNALAM